MGKRHLITMPMVKCLSKLHIYILRNLKIHNLKVVLMHRCDDVDNVKIKLHTFPNSKSIYDCSK